MRRQRLAAETSSLANHDTCDQAGDTGIDVNDRSASKIEHSPIREQSATTGPGHMANWQIRQSKPDYAEDEHGAEFHALRERANNQRRSDDGERELESSKHHFRNRP
jgi:hypothetical protein